MDSSRRADESGASMHAAKPFNHSCSFAFEPLERWSKFHVADSLRALGVYAVGEPTEAKSFERYASQFLSENMDGHSLLNLTCVKLKNKLNVDNMDHRRKIFDWIEHLMVASGSDEQSTALHATRRSSHIRSSSWQQLDLEMHALQQLRTQQGQDLKMLQRHVLSLQEEVRGSGSYIAEIMQEAEAAAMDAFQDMSKHFAATLSRKLELETTNRELYNEVQDLKGAIRVICRIRPVMPFDEDQHLGTSCSAPDPTSLLLDQPDFAGRTAQNQGSVCKLFKFDRVYGPSSTQPEVFSSTEPLVRSVLDGFNVCIFAYGQTGSGKTHTMMGAPDHPGINVQALDLLFKLRDAREDQSMVYEIGMEMREIYNENIRDLLAGTPQAAQQPKWNSTNEPRKMGERESTRVVQVNNTRDVLEMVKCGEGARSVGATALNEHSSRSHCIVTVFAEGHNASSGERLSGRLQLVDLAGSERVLRSEAQGERLKEAQHINRSLSALGDVIAALQEKRSHVPFRNSVLTRHLQDSMSGNSKVLMVAHINPMMSSVQESLSTLTFAQRVASVQLGRARQNVESQDLVEAREEMPRLREDLEKTTSALHAREKEVDSLQAKLRRLEDSSSKTSGSRHLAEEASKQLCEKMQVRLDRVILERDDAREGLRRAHETMAELRAELVASRPLAPSKQEETRTGRHGALRIQPESRSGISSPHHASTFSSGRSTGTSSPVGRASGTCSPTSRTSIHRTSTHSARGLKPYSTYGSGAMTSRDHLDAPRNHLARDTARPGSRGNLSARTSLPTSSPNSPRTKGPSTFSRTASRPSGSMSLGSTPKPSSTRRDRFVPPSLNLNFANRGGEATLVNSGARRSLSATTPRSPRTPRSLSQEPQSRARGSLSARLRQEKISSRRSSVYSRKADDNGQIDEDRPFRGSNGYTSDTSGGNTIKSSRSASALSGGEKQLGSNRGAVGSKRWM
mmetsp:Transcript_9331/g.17449  ORF Transcript_9331/g.17449 Transcript_9331/m.17449 type:complete len:965 (-) Transcript_9331:275-3169(-)